MPPKPLRKPTQQEIADYAGVSLATVDRVVSGRASVRQKTKDLVNEAIQVLSEGARGKEPESLSSKVLASKRFVLIVEAGQPFVKSVESIICDISDRYVALGIDIEVHAFEPDIGDVIGCILGSAQEADGLILCLRETSKITQAVAKVIESGTPVVCLHCDLPSTGRLGYFGMNHLHAGRAAAVLMGDRLLGQVGEVAVIVSAPYRAQYDRESGFRQVMRARYPNLTIHEAINNCDSDEEGYLALKKLIEQGHCPLGVYNTTGGNIGISKFLEEYSKTAQRPVFITHELDSASEGLLADGKIDFVIGQDLWGSVVSAVNALLYSIGLLDTQPSSLPTAPVIEQQFTLGARPRVAIPRLTDIV